MTKPPDSIIWPNTFILDCVPAKLEPEHVGLRRPTRTRDTNKCIKRRANEATRMVSSGGSESSFVRSVTL